MQRPSLSPPALYTHVPFHEENLRVAEAEALRAEFDDEEELAQQYVVAVVQWLVAGLVLFAVFIASLHVLGFKVWMKTSPSSWPREL